MTWLVGSLALAILIHSFSTPWASRPEVTENFVHSCRFGADSDAFAELIHAKLMEANLTRESDSVIGKPIGILTARHEFVDSLKIC